tara:strand:- start:506 stop:616 length:111 start_codon:yes stop_codon:yes gene_type:complete
MKRKSHAKGGTKMKKNHMLGVAQKQKENYMLGVARK